MRFSKRGLAAKKMSVMICAMPGRDPQLCWETYQGLKFCKPLDLCLASKASCSLFEGRGMEQIFPATTGDVLIQSYPSAIKLVEQAIDEVAECDKLMRKARTDNSISLQNKFVINGLVEDG